MPTPMFPVLVFGSLALLIQEPSCPQPPYELSAFEAHLPPAGAHEEASLRHGPPFPRKPIRSVGA